MNWEKLTPLLEKSIEEVMQIKNLDERLAMLIFNVAEKVEVAERESCAKLADEWSGHYQANEITKSIRARGQE
jgi:hypothetical protein